MKNRPVILVVVLLLLAGAAWLLLRDLRQRRGADDPPAEATAEAEPSAGAEPPPTTGTAAAPADDPPAPELSEEEYQQLVEMARLLQSAPEGFDEGIHCRLSQEVEPFQGHFLRTVRGNAMGQFPAYTSGDMVSLVVDLRRAEGFLHVPGYQPAQVGWTTDRETGEARCRPDPIELVPGEALVRGLVRNAEGEPEGRVWVEGCGGHALTRTDGTYELSATPDPCMLQAFRLDGVFTARGPIHDVDPVAGGVVRVDLEVPDFPTAGMGIAIRETDDGILILEAVEGGDAAEQGLREGDLIVSIDGEPTVEMTLEEFVDLALGREGTEVELVVSSDGEERELSITRKTLDP